MRPGITKPHVTPPLGSTGSFFLKSSVRVADWLVLEKSVHYHFNKGFGSNIHVLIYHKAATLQADERKRLSFFRRSTCEGRLIAKGVR